MKENNIFNRLYDQETPPPAFMWDRIAKKLDEEEEANATPLVVMANRPKNNWLKIVAAASIIGMIATTTLWIIEKNKKETVAKVDVEKSSTNPSISKENIPTPNLNQNDTNLQTNHTIISENTDQIVSNSTAPFLNNTKQAPTTPYTNSSEKNNLIKPNPINNPQKEIIVKNNANINAITNINDAKITIKDENGNAVKNISEVNTSSSSTIAGPDSKADKAIANILTKLSLSSDKEEIDNIINESVYWKKQIQIWRTKLIKSGYAPSVVNHLDLIELIKIIDEKK